VYQRGPSGKSGRPLNSWLTWKTLPDATEKKTNALPNAGGVHTAEQQQKARAAYDLRGAITSRSFFAVISVWSVGQKRTKTIPDPVRLALPRPPNLDSQYQST